MKKFFFFAVLVLGTACLIMLSGFTLPQGWTIPVLVCAIMLDFLSTYLCMRAGGREGNPVVATIFKKLGIWATFILACVVWAALIEIRISHTDLGSQTAIALAYWWVPVNNFIVLARLKRRQAKAG